jgi:hypothetical protein
VHKGDSPRTAAIRQLPDTYALALRLRDAQLPDDVLADCLGIDVAGLAILLTMAEAKLEALLNGIGR